MVAGSVDGTTRRPGYVVGSAARGGGSHSWGWRRASNRPISALGLVRGDGRNRKWPAPAPAGTGPHDHPSFFPVAAAPSSSRGPPPWHAKSGRCFDPAQVHRALATGPTGGSTWCNSKSRSAAVQAGGPAPPSVSSQARALTDARPDATPSVFCCLPPPPASSRNHLAPPPVPGFHLSAAGPSGAPAVSLPAVHQHLRQLTGT